MAKKEPLYPHVPKNRKTGVSSPNQEVELRFLPDSPEFITQSVNSTGYRARLESVIREAIKRANEVKR